MSPNTNKGRGGGKWEARPPLHKKQTRKEGQAKKTKTLRRHVQRDKKQARVGRFPSRPGDVLQEEDEDPKEPKLDDTSPESDADPEDQEGSIPHDEDEGGWWGGDFRDVAFESWMKGEAEKDISSPGSEDEVGLGVGESQDVNDCTTSPRPHFNLTSTSSEMMDLEVEMARLGNFVLA